MNGNGLQFDNNNFLTADSLQIYKDRSGGICPFCGNTNLEWGHLEWTETGSYGEVSCWDCGALWGEGHVTVEVINIKAE